MRTIPTILALFAILPLIVSSTNYSNNTAGLWGAATWNPSTPPADGTGHTALISTNSIYTSSTISNWSDITVASSAKFISSSLTNCSITVENTAEIQLRENAVVDANTTIIVENGGTLTIGKNVTIQGTIIVEEGGTLTDMTNLTSVGSSFFSETGSNFTIDGGSLTYECADASSSFTMEVPWGAEMFSVINGGAFRFDNRDAGNHAEVLFKQNFSNILIGEDSKFDFVNTSARFDNTGFGTVEIDGYFSITDGNIYSSSAYFNINAAGDCSSEGALILRDMDFSDDGRTSLTDNSPTNYGIFYTGNGIGITVDGLLMTEEISATLGGGGATVENNERVFVKKFSSGTAGGNTITNTNAPICSDNEVLDAMSTPYPGSYLYYCSDDGNLNFIENDGTMFYSTENGDPTGILNPASSGDVANFYGTDSECYFDFYSITSNVLPIELKEFYATQVKDAVEITWITASEKNNEIFYLTKSIDGKDFYTIEQKDGQINSSTETIYKYNDDSPVNGINYYQLIQKDLDGASTKSDIIASSFSKPNFRLDRTSISNRIITVYFENSSTNYLSIYNINGEKIYAKKISGTNTHSFKVDFPIGQYFIKNTSGENNFVSPIIIK